ncbi:MAG: MBL fold metallo-hydrolase [Rhizobiaceae bacterium]
MPRINRRFLMQTAGAALALPGLMVRAAHALDMSAVKAPAFSRYSLGAFEITSLSDGHRLVPDPQSIFGTNQSKETVEALLDANLLPRDQMQFTFAPTLVNTGTDLILFDTGNGEGGREGGVGHMLANLRASGYSPDQVTLVVVSHCHPDHIGGLTEGGQPAFPNARYAVGQAEYAFWTDSARTGTPAEGVAKMVAAKVTPFADKTAFFGDASTVAPGVTAALAPGHTPGHAVFRIESGGKSLMLTADTANHFVLSLQNPDWEVRFDADKAAAAASRRKVFDMIAADRIPFIGYHMPFPSVGYVERVGTGYRFVPESYQLDL